MKQRLIHTLILLLTLQALLAPAAAEERPRPPRPRALGYVLEPVFDADAVSFRVELSFEGDASGTTRLETPVAWASARDLDKGIRNLTVVTKGARLADTAEPNMKTVSHAPGQKVVVRYELVQVQPGPPAAGRGGGYQPLLQKDYFHWVGHGAWVKPAWGESARVAVTLEWKNLPKGWSTSNSFGANRRKQKFVAFLGEFEHAVYAGGDFRVVERRVAGRPVYVTIRGSWKFSDADFVGLVERVVSTERDFWRDHDYPYYLITLLPLDGPPSALSIGGTGLTNSFATFVTTNAELKDLRFLLAHELFHNWNSPKLGRIPSPEQLSYWISEGFTDYYTYVLLVRSGLYTPGEYAAHYNEMMRSYYLSPARNASNERVQAEFWTDPQVGQLPYWRGALLAMKWDTAIRRASGGRHSLDDVMRDLFAEAKRDPGRPLTAEAIDQHVRRYAGHGILDDVRRYVVDGETIPPDPDGLGDGYRPTEVEIAHFDLGLDLETLKAKKEIAGVKPDSAAFAAGLRDGQSVARRKPIYVGDATKEVEITIKDGDRERTITYLPAGRGGPKVPQYEPRDGRIQTERDDALNARLAPGGRR
jgi:predicted metalloprotease with PDZ domain